MPDSVDYWLYLDSIQVRTGKVKLDSGDSLKFSVNSGIYRVNLTVNQVAHHPIDLFVSAMVEPCLLPLVISGISGVHHFPIPQRTNSKIHCLPIQDSYDPNDKQAFPMGFTNKHIVKPGSQMEYLIRFQNTGSDTAFTVYVIDSLDNNFNPETIELGTASHPFEISMQTTKQGRTFLRWQFDHINLPDSNVNEVMSHGFFQYRISPKLNLALGSQVKNEARIYFDFNLPVTTNQTLTTFDSVTYTNPILNNLVQVVTSMSGRTAARIGVQLFPNPVTQRQLYVRFASKGSLILYDSKGQIIVQKENLEGTQRLPVELKAGIYFVLLRTEIGNSTEKIVVVN